MILDRAGQWLASTTVGAQVISRVMPAMDTFVMKVTGGRATFNEAASGLPTIHLTTRGAKTGLSRTVPLVAVVDGDQLAIIGSNWGRPQHPAWVHNLLADPRATVARGRHRLPVTARELTGPDADRVWQHARAVYRGFRTYPTRTRGRTIRVFLLEKASG